MVRGGADSGHGGRAARCHGKILHSAGQGSTVRTMKAATAETELMEISRKLAPKKRQELLKYGRTLYAQSTKKNPATMPVESGDAAWERIISDSKPRPKLRAFVERVLREEKAEPMDIKRL